MIFLPPLGNLILSCNDNDDESLLEHHLSNYYEFHDIDHDPIITCYDYMISLSCSYHNESDTHLSAHSRKCKV